jgi:hypothetical protein
LPRSGLDLLENLGAVQSFGSRILDQIDVFACFKPEMLTLQQLNPAKNRYVYLKDESGERCVSLAFFELLAASR